MHQDIETAQQEIPFRVGESVKIISGPFQDFTARLESIDPVKERLKAFVPWNPRQFTDSEFVPLYERSQELLVELDFRQIDRSL